MAPKQDKQAYDSMMSLFAEYVNTGLIEQSEAVKFIQLNIGNLKEYDKLRREYDAKIAAARAKGGEAYAKKLEKRRDQIFRELATGTEQPKSAQDARRLLVGLRNRLSISLPGDPEARVKSLSSEFAGRPKAFQRFLEQDYVTDERGNQTPRIESTHTQTDLLLSPMLEGANQSKFLADVPSPSKDRVADFIQSVSDPTATGAFIDELADEYLERTSTDSVLDALQLPASSDMRSLGKEYLRGAVEAKIYRDYANAAADQLDNQATRYDELTDEEKTEHWKSLNSLALRTAAESLEDEGFTQTSIVEDHLAGVSNPVEGFNSKFAYAAAKGTPALDTYRALGTALAEASGYGDYGSYSGSRRGRYSRLLPDEENPFIKRREELRELQEAFKDNPRFNRIATELGFSVREGETPTPRQVNRAIAAVRRAPRKRLRSAGQQVEIDMLDRSKGVPLSGGELLFFRDSVKDGNPYVSQTELEARSDKDLRDGKGKVVVVDLDSADARSEAARVAGESTSALKAMQMVDQMYQRQPDKAQGSVLLLSEEGEYAIVGPNQIVKDRGRIEDTGALESFRQNPSFVSIAGDNRQFRKTRGHNPLQSLDDFTVGEPATALGLYLPSDVVQTEEEPIVKRRGLLMRPSAAMREGTFVLSGMYTNEDGVEVNAADVFSLEDVRGEPTVTEVEGFAGKLARGRSARKARRRGRRQAGRTKVRRTDEAQTPSALRDALRQLPAEPAAPEEPAEAAPTEPAPTAPAPAKPAKDEVGGGRVGTGAGRGAGTKTETETVDLQDEVVPDIEGKGSFAPRPTSARRASDRPLARALAFSPLGESVEDMVSREAAEGSLGIGGKGSFAPAPQESRSTTNNAYKQAFAASSLAESAKDASRRAETSKYPGIVADGSGAALFESPSDLTLMKDEEKEEEDKDKDKGKDKDKKPPNS